MALFAIMYLSKSSYKQTQLNNYTDIFFGINLSDKIQQAYLLQVR